MDVSFQAVMCPGVWVISPCFASLSDYQRAAFGFVGFVRLGPEMGPKIGPPAVLNQAKGLPQLVLLLAWTLSM